jgi:hypothetical protein
VRGRGVKLSIGHERWIHAILMLVYLSGLGWMVLRYGIAGESEPDSPWRVAQAWLLRAHGATAMLTLVAVGSVLAAHVPASWTLRRNLASGVGMLASMAVLVVTGWLLYYASGEDLRAGSAYLHMALGAAGPLALLWHLAYRRRVARRAKRARTPTAAKNVTPLRQIR